MPFKPTKPDQEQRPALRLPREEAVKKLTAHIAKGRELLKEPIQTKDQLQDARAAFTNWRDYGKELLRDLFSTSELADGFSRVGLVMFSVPSPLYEDIEAFRDTVKEYINRLTSIVERIELYPLETPRSATLTAVAMIERVIHRFPAVARQLRQRHGHRPAFDVHDEYDVQDLLHALLRLFFDDIRPEEWTPSYAGGSARMDFLLKAEHIVIEVKKTHLGLRDREIGNQLIEDIARYHKHPDCKTLICFVYDPDGWIANPDGLERDLSQEMHGVAVNVIIAPKGH